MNLKRFFVLYCTALLPFLGGWGGPGGETHRNITRAALDRVPQQQLEILKPALDDIKNTYCLIPDLARRDPNWKPYLMGDLSLHIADTSESNVKIYKYYTKTVIAKIKAGNNNEGARFCILRKIHFVLRICATAFKNSTAKNLLVLNFSKDLSSCRQNIKTLIFTR